jgi:hypothetical protein
MRIPRLFPICLLALALLAQSAAATIVLRVTVEDLAEKATLIVSGEVTEASARWTDDRATINTYVQIRVDKVVKGQADGTVEVTCPGGAVGDKRVAVEGVPKFTVGEQVFVFLWKNKRGEMLPLGLNQGKFLIEKDPDSGELMAKNSLEGLCFARRGTIGKAASSKPDRLELADLERRVRERLERLSKADDEDKPKEAEGETKPADEPAKPEHASKPEESEPDAKETEKGDHASQPTEEEKAPEKEKPGEEPKAEEAEKPEPEKKKPEEETPPGRR